MKKMATNQKIILLMLITVFLICWAQGVSHGGSVIGGIGGALGAAGTAIGTGLGAAGTAIGTGLGAAGTAIGIGLGAAGTAVGIAAGTVLIAAGVLDLSVRLILTVFWDTHSLSNMAVIPDGGIIGIAASNLIHLGDLHTGALHTTLTYDALIHSIAFSPNRSMLASGSADGTVQLWNPDTETLQATLQGHTSNVLSVAFSPDGALLASGSADGLVQLWNPDTETLQATLEVHIDRVLSVAFSPDGALLASASADGLVGLWDPHMPQLKATLGHESPVLSVAFSPDGDLLASGSTDGTARLWDPHTPQLKATLGHESPVLSVAFSPDGDLLASGSTDGTARLWDPHTPQLKATLGHESPVESVAFDGDMLVSGSQEGRVRQWEITTETVPSSSSQRSEFESTTPAGYTRVTLNDRDTVWGVPTKYTTDSDVGTVAYMLLATLKGCSFANTEVARQSKVYIKTQSLGLLNNFASETGCRKTSRTWTSSWNGVRITHLRFFDESNTPNIREAVYNPATGQIELLGEGEQPSEIAYPPVASDSQPEGVTASIAAPLTESTLDESIVTLTLSGRAYERSSFRIRDAVMLSGIAGVTVATFGIDRVSDTQVTVELEFDGSFQTDTHLTFTVEAEAIADYNGPALTARIPVTAGPEADANNDGVVDTQDLVLVASNYGKTGQNAADINGDGVVNISDLTTVASALDNAAAAPLAHPQALEMFTAADIKLWLSHAQQLDLTDATSLRGVLFLEQLLAVLLPKETVLLANYPNPFNPETWIPYRLAKDAFVTLTIYDGSGQVIRTLNVGHQIAAFYESRSKAIHWDGKNEFGEGVASGVYFYHLSAGDFSATRKMLIIK